MWIASQSYHPFKTEHLAPILSAKAFTFSRGSRLHKSRLLGLLCCSISHFHFFFTNILKSLQEKSHWMAMTCISQA
uniref:Uncharacterized protein n=1 Tax=Populus trichocarpa TaxID=3694 RepID=A0A3N7FYC5_POPTR